MTRLHPIPVKRALVPLLAASLACSIFGPDDGLESDLAAARARWAAVGLDAYTFRLQRICFCLPESLGPAWVTVIDGEVDEVVYVDSGEPVPEPYAQGFPGVEGLFELIEQALAQSADLVDVTYDPESGTPVDVYIDYQENAADEELGFSATIPTPID